MMTRVSDGESCVLEVGHSQELAYDRTYAARCRKRLLTGPSTGRRSRSAVCGGCGRPSSPRPVVTLKAVNT